MKKNKSNVASLEYFKRRYVIVCAAKLFGLLVLVWKLIKMQLFNYLIYNRLSFNNSRRIDYILPLRGNILDRNGIAMTQNISITKLVFYKTKHNIDDVLTQVFQLLNKNSSDIAYLTKKIKKKLATNPNERFVIARYLSHNDLLRIQFNLTYLPGVEIVDSKMRNYPMGSFSPAVLGVVMRPTTEVADKRLLNNTDYKTGATGIEKLYNEKLSGIIGINASSVDAFGNKVNETIVREAINGLDVKTTIDYNIQNKLANIIGDRSGCATIIDLKTGNILAMHSTPNIDPNLYSKGIDEDNWKEIANNKKAILFNKNISVLYPPGSTFKLICTIVALQQGWDPHKKFTCTGEYQIGNRIFHCWKKEGHGAMCLDTAIAQSCNCYFYHMSTKVDIDDIYKLATLLGLGVKTAIGLEQERIGLVPNRAWKKKHFKQIWMPGDNANTFVGQGFLEATPLQLLLMISQIATNKIIKPYFISNDNQNDFQSLGISEEVLNIVKHCLYSVVNDRNNGILRRFRSSDETWQVCGKTGSAQVVSMRILDSDMKAGRIKEQMRPHGLFVGFAPYHDPKFAISVVIEHGIGGAISGAPVGIEMLNELKYFV